MTIPYSPSERTLQIHQDALVFDGHCDSLIEITDGVRSWDVDSGIGQLDLPRLKAGGIDAQIFAVFVRDLRLKDGAKETLAMIETLHGILETWTGEMTLATKAEHIRQARRSGKIAAILGMEGAEGLEGEIKLLRAYHRLGLRNIGLTWNRRNHAADGVAESRSGGGLTEFGRLLVQEMRRLGIMLDIAHLAPAGVQDVFQVYEGPVVASHANAHAICRHRRNLTDEQLEAVAASGGLVGVTFVPDFLSEQGKEEPSLFDKLLEHIEHIVHLVGIDHVGIGSDWDGNISLPAGFMQDVSHTPMLTEGLVQRGFTEAQIRKILGENWLRVFEQVAG